MHRILSKSLEKIGFLNDCQCGFRKGLDITDSLLKFVFEAFTISLEITNLVDFSRHFKSFLHGKY